MMLHTHAWKSRARLTVLTFGLTALCGSPIWGAAWRSTSTTTGIVSGLINPDLTATKLSIGSLAVPGDAYKVGFVSADAKVLRLNTTLTNGNASLLGVANGTGNFVLNSSVNGFLFGTGTPGTTGIGTERMRLTSAGKLGVGTTTPLNTLDANGGVAIGAGFAGVTTAPANGLLVKGQVGVNASTLPSESNLVLGANGGAEGGQIQLNSAGSPMGTRAALLDVYSNSSTNNYLRFLGGTDAGSDSWLASLDLTTGDFGVVGKLTASSIQIHNWTLEAPDYVFEPGYKLKSLEETEAYVQKNKHLPEVPSAVQMKDKGVDLVDMNMKLLQKVEELTLHAIEQNKRIAKLEAVSRNGAEHARTAP